MSEHLATSLARRMLGAALLDVDTYEEVEADRGATLQAFAVVVISAVAGGVGTIANHGADGILWHTLNSVVLWWVWAFVTYFVGTRFLPTEETVADHGELLRILEEKGHLRHEQDGPRYVFLPIVPAEKARDSALRHLLRTFFDESHQRFSEGFRLRQPWPGFVNGFKSTEAVDLVSISPPAFEEDGTARVDVLLDLTQNEGEEPVVRRFLVQTETVQEGAEWYLSGVSTREQRD